MTAALPCMVTELGPLLQRSQLQTSRALSLAPNAAAQPPFRTRPPLSRATWKTRATRRARERRGRARRVRRE
eukprot:400470-Rhodomonas_salina.1